MIIVNTWSRALARALALTALLAFGSAAVAAEAAAEAEALEPTPADDLKVTQAASLDELLSNVEQRRVVESREHSQREATFARDKAAQAKMLADAKAEQGREERAEVDDEVECVIDAWKFFPVAAPELVSDMGGHTGLDSA